MSPGRTDGPGDFLPGHMALPLRESGNIWVMMCHRWGWKSILRGNVFRNPYFWHDSFSVYWYRWVGCRFFGHRCVQDLAFDKSQSTDYFLYCFHCFRKVEGPYKGPVSKLAEEKYRQLGIQAARRMCRGTNASRFVIRRQDGRYFAAYIPHGNTSWVNDPYDPCVKHFYSRENARLEVAWGLTPWRMGSYTVVEI